MTRFDEIRDAYGVVYGRYLEIVAECETALISSGKANGQKWAVDSRVKEPASFLIKALYRGKGYLDPIRDIKDTAGVRVIVGDLAAVARATEIVKSTLLASGYECCEEDDKRAFADNGADEYIAEYRGTHFIFRCKSRDYLPVEVQIHTKAESAWAEASHRLIYKPVVELSGEYKRKLRRLMALVEVIDEQIEAIQTMVEADEDYGALQLMSGLESAYFELSGQDPRDRDQQFGLELTRSALQVLPQATLQADVEQFVEANQDRLKQFYAEYASSGTVLLASLPESLLFLAMISRRRSTTSQALADGVFDAALVEKLASNFGTPVS